MSQSTAIIGLQYGDEGKGQIVDALCADHDVVVRYNGGANAGHHVRIGNQVFVLHQIPVGVLTPGRTNLLAGGVVLSAPAFLQEVEMLTAAGVDVTGIRVSDRAHLVMPWHLTAERYRHELAERLMGADATLGTTFKGIGPCYADKANRDTAIRVADLYQHEALRQRLRFILSLKNAELDALAKELGHHFEPFRLEALLHDCETWAEGLRAFVTDTAELLRQASANESNILFEGANAALLDIDAGTFPFVTSSNGSTLGIDSGAGIAISHGLYRVGVAKAYMSRVGTGPFVTEITGTEAEQLRALGDEYGSTTGRPRRVGWLDLPALRHVVTRNRIDALVLTGLSVLAQLPRFRVCTHYREGDVQFETLPASVERLNACEGVFTDIATNEALSEHAPLPGWVNELIELIETRVGPVAGICLGRRRDQVRWLS